MGQLARQKPKVFADQDIRMFFIPRSRVEIPTAPNKYDERNEGNAFADKEEEEKIASDVGQRMTEDQEHEEEDSILSHVACSVMDAG